MTNDAHASFIDPTAMPAAPDVVLLVLATVKNLYVCVGGGKTQSHNLPNAYISVTNCHCALHARSNKELFQLALENIRGSVKPRI